MPPPDVADPPAHADAPAEVAPNDVVQGHVPCVGCGYDLHLRPRAGVCPECGRDVAPSLSLELLHLPALRLARGPLIANAWLSGLCVGASLGFLAGLGNRSAFDPTLGAVLFWMLLTAVFAFTVMTAAKAEINLLRGAGRIETLRARLRGNLVPNLVATLGILALDVGALLLALGFRHFGEVSAWACIAVGFLLLGAVAYRFVPLYRALGDVAATLQWPRLASYLRRLGWAKAIVETAWLGVCLGGGIALAASRASEDVAIGLLFAGLFGIVAYAAIWVMMIVAHTLLSRAIARLTAPAGSP